MHTLTTLVESSHNQLTLLNAFTTPKRLAWRFSWTMNIIPTNAKLVQSSSDFEDDCLETLWEKSKTEDDDKNNTKERMRQHNNSTRRQNNNETRPESSSRLHYSTSCGTGLWFRSLSDWGCRHQSERVSGQTHLCSFWLLRSIIWRSDEKHVKLMRMMMMMVLQRWARRDQQGKRGESTD